MNELINVNQISKNFNDKEALKNINLTVNRGEIIGIVGHNGAGKTTLVNCMTGIYEPDKGTIDYIFDYKSLYDHIGVQMQEQYYEWKSKVFEVCQLYKQITRSDINLEEMLEEFELTSEANNYINQLSGGNRQKLAILLTLINQPEIIFLDELTTGLDPVAKRKVWDLLKDINETKEVTIILTSHNLDEVEYLADRIMILYKGEVVYLGGMTSAVEEYSEGEKIIEFQIKNELASFKLMKYNAETLTDGRYQIRTKNDEQVLKELIDDVGIKNVVVKSPGLEDVFLKIAGYRLDKEGRIING
ncbi:ABC transporter ATP-binding protein [Natranaerobius thermophilus]|uniref:ABC transporter related n=1 Tax=Natranaerobius thermophilus (strain ATCC BAA-1301 / DSM 18059 / JW/NM-WN-LF) TaxID=457570 RepID=B2A4G6_NATTJ|nr:ABC transporter ATP-binding protein [Natranaerobius thermophilus]ACB85143.1 ABC transporter related [Natranaerobius thermophilus JW/NM-WN-LF]